MAVTRSTRVHYIAIILYGLISVVVYAPLSVLRDSSNVLRATVDTENGEKKKPVASLWPVRASGIYFCIIEIPSTFLLTTINTLTVHQLSKTLMLFFWLEILLGGLQSVGIAVFFSAFRLVYIYNQL